MNRERIESGGESPKLSIILPCWNEEANLFRGVLGHAYDYLRQQAFAWEVHVVDDGSTDRSAQIVRDRIGGMPGFRLHQIPHGGKVAAVWAGIQASRGDAVLIADMDQSTPLHELGKLLPWLDEGYDVVIGSRGMARSGFSFVRRTGSLVFLTLRRLLLLRSIRDTQCGFKLCRRAAVLDVFPRLQYVRQGGEAPSGWKVSAYDVELLFLLDRLGYAIKEVPVEWADRDQSETKGRTGGRYVVESLDMLTQIVRVRSNQLRGLYDE